MKQIKLRIAAMVGGVLLSGVLLADVPTYEIHIKEHQFTPKTLEVPAGQKVKLVVYNDDATPEEFESYDLNREKIIKGNSKGVVFIGPLKAGEYKYFGEFNEDTAQGVIKAVE